MRIFTLIMISALVGCGQQESTTQTTTTSEPQEATFTAMLVKAKEKLKCDEKNAGQLIYDQTAKLFYFCNDNQEWEEIDLQGVAGAAGVNGTDGKNGTSGVDGSDGKNGFDGVAGKDGVNGVDGANGINGTNGIDGEDGVDAATDHWVDSVTHRNWYNLGLMNSSKGIGTNTCGGSFTNQIVGSYLPASKAELEAAIAHGLDFGGDFVWLSRNSFQGWTTDDFYYYDMDQTSVGNDIKALASLYCVEVK